MRQPFSLGTLFLALAFVVCSCSPDTDPPTFSLTSPTAAISDSATAVIKITGSATDDSPLGSVDVSLISDLGKLESYKTEPLSGSSASFDFPFTLGNLYTPTGHYTLKVTVSDSEGNFSSLFFDVNLVEVPLRLIGPLVYGSGPYAHWFTQEPGQPAVERFNVFPEPIYAWDVSMTGKSILLGGHYSELYMYSLIDFTHQYTYHVYPPLGEYAFRSMDEHEGEFYCGMEFEPYVRVFESNGNQRSTFPNAAFSPKLIKATGTALYIAGTIPPSNYSVQMLNLSTGIPMASTSISYDPLFLMEISGGRLLLAGLEAGSSSTVTLLDASNLTTISEYSVPYNIIRMDGNEDLLYFSDGSGIFRLDPNTGAVTSFASGIYSSIGYDKATNTVYCGEYETLHRYNSDGTLIESVTGFSGIMLHAIKFIYNK